ncbi:MAG: peptidase S41, partial [Candidatus Marinimicrobia bacterium]|nr:peptidase S41 [Candidatus Neomarinimicrobiota bacterium]
MRTRIFTVVLTLLVSFATAQTVSGQINARILRFPDVSESRISFVYAGDIWIAPKTGGTAHKLSSPAGHETFPKFSPDGTELVFTGNYDGNHDLYRIPVSGGTPTRLTHHPLNDRMLDWYPAEDMILFASSMESGRQRFRQFYKVSREGGFPEKLPVPYGEFGAISPDGNRIAYTPLDRSFRTWKRYRGGWAPDIWLFNLNTYESENITEHPANDSHPMWHLNTLYFLSDRGPEMRQNIWKYDLDTGAMEQVTTFTEYDIHFPSIGPRDIIFEAGGELYLLDLTTEEARQVKINVVTDQTGLKPVVEKVGNRITRASVSPDGNRVFFQARGEIFNLPAENGPTYNLTRTSGVAERFPAWSPDGSRIAYWTDRNGEYQLVIRAADGSGEEELFTDPEPGFRYTLHWSPDSKKLAFIDHTMTIRVYDTERDRLRQVDQDNLLYHPNLDDYHIHWSSDSRWLAYSKVLDNSYRAIFLYDFDENEAHQVTNGFYSDNYPVFDPDGKYLYITTNRHLSPQYSDLQSTWIYMNTTQIAAIPLRKDVASPLGAKNDTVVVKRDDENDTAETEEGEEKSDEESESLEIELDGFERRLVMLPAAPGNYSDLSAVSGRVLYHRHPRSGSADEQHPVVSFNLESREEETIIDNASFYQLTADGQKMLVGNRGQFAVVDVAPGQKMEKPIDTGTMEMTVNPQEEWQQIFTEAWRFNRDFFYDPNMHQLDWDAMRQQYGDLLQYAVTRWDVNYIIGELIGELNASHTYRGGGDTEDEKRRSVGMLGIDWALENGAYRIDQIIRGAEWDSEVRSALDEPGIDISEGEYILAVNGVPMDTDVDPWAAFDGLAGKTVELTVNDEPTMEGSRKVIIETLSLGEELRLRNLAWINQNRLTVAEATDDQVGYIYVPNTSTSGQTELVRQFIAQSQKPGLIIDERFNSGGQLSNRFIELLNRNTQAYGMNRYGENL